MGKKLDLLLLMIKSFTINEKIIEKNSVSINTNKLYQACITYEKKTIKYKYSMSLIGK